MKTFWMLIFAFGLITVSSCKKDDDTETINYDGRNATSPTLPQGTYELAARYTSGVVTPYVGTNLTEVEYYMTQEVQFLRLKIYGMGDNGLPGSVLYSKDISRDQITGGWNTHELGDPIEITGEDLWVSMRLTLANQQQSLGCDGGPADPNGDLVYIEASDEWTTYRSWTGESINWNLRGKVK